MIDLVAGISAFFLHLYFMIFAPNVVEANHCSKRNDISYCYYKGHPESNRVVYYLHGFGNDETAWSWNYVTARIEQIWRGKKRPHVISMSFGKLWWYTEKSQGEKLMSFLNAFEKELKLEYPERVLYGDSMGGHNSLRWAGDFPDYFTKLVVSCPAIPTSFAKKIRGSSGIFPFNYVADSILSSRLTTYKLANPVKDPEYIKRFNTIKNVHIMVVTNDHFGFHSGGSDLFDVMKRDDISAVTFEEQDVRHCDMNPEHLSAFLMN